MNTMDAMPRSISVVSDTIMQLWVRSEFDRLLGELYGPYSIQAEERSQLTKAMMNQYSQRIENKS